MCLGVFFPTCPRPPLFWAGCCPGCAFAFSFVAFSLFCFDDSLLGAGALAPSRLPPWVGFASTNLESRWCGLLFVFECLPPLLGCCLNECGILMERRFCLFLGVGLPPFWGFVLAASSPVRGPFVLFLALRHAWRCFGRIRFWAALPFLPLWVGPCPFCWAFLWVSGCRFCWFVFLFGFLILFFAFCRAWLGLFFVFLFVWLCVSLCVCSALFSSFFIFVGSGACGLFWGSIFPPARAASPPAPSF